MTQGIIFLYCTNTILNGEDAKEAWFVLIPSKHIEKGFASHFAYQDYLNLIGIKREPKLHSIERIAEYWGDHDKIDWQQIEDN